MARLLSMPRLSEDEDEFYWKLIRILRIFTQKLVTVPMEVSIVMGVSLNGWFFPWKIHGKYHENTIIIHYKSPRCTLKGWDNCSSTQEKRPKKLLLTPRSRLSRLLSKVSIDISSEDTTSFELIVQDIPVMDSTRETKKIETPRRG